MNRIDARYSKAACIVGLGLVTLGAGLGIGMGSGAEASQKMPKPPAACVTAVRDLGKVLAVSVGVASIGSKAILLVRTALKAGYTAGSTDTLAPAKKVAAHDKALATAYGRQDSKLQALAPSVEAAVHACLSR